jgi:hypothetical protein
MVLYVTVEPQEYRRRWPLANGGRTMRRIHAKNAVRERLACGSLTRQLRLDTDARQ